MSWRARFSFALRVSGVHRVILGIMALLVADALVLAVLKPQGLVADLPGFLIVVQIFAASTGYTRAARAGYLDPLLLSSARRWSNGLILFFAAFTPGLLAWIAAGAAQWYSLGWQRASCLHLGGFIALFFVSGVSWAMNLTLPRYTSGLLWVLVMVSVPMLATRLFADLIEVIAKSPQNLESHLGAALALGASVPISIPTIHWPHHAELVFLALGAILLATGLIYIDRSEVPLAS